MLAVCILFFCSRIGTFISLNVSPHREFCVFSIDTILLTTEKKTLGFDVGGFAFKLVMTSGRKIETALSGVLVAHFHFVRK